MWKKRNNLDEQQELQMLKIESRGFWIAFWGSLLVFFVQALSGGSAISVISSWVLFMAITCYISIASIKAGIWDRHMDMSRKTCVVVSFIAAVITGTFETLLLSRHAGLSARLFAVGAAVFAVTFILCYIALRVTAKVVKNRQNKLNAEPDDTMDKGE